MSEENMEVRVRPRTSAHAAASAWASAPAVSYRLTRNYIGSK